jgi:hypothetical protein
MRKTFVLSVATALMATIALIVTGVVLASVYRNSVERAFDARLSAYMRMLVVNLVSADKRLKVLPQSIGETLFELPLSGWYWQINALGVSKPEIRSSRSLWDTGLTRLHDEDAATSPDGLRHGYAIGPAEQRLRLIERAVDLGDDGRYLIAVAGDALEIDDQMRFFQEAIAVSFGFLATLLALMMYFHTRLVRVGLARQAPSGAA